MALNTVSSDRLSTNVKTSTLGTELKAKVGANKNLIINGAMQVAQRGTSSTSEGFVVDRMKTLFNGTDEAPTTSQESISSSDAGPYELGFTKYLRITNGNQTGGAGAADYILFRQALEAQNIANSGWRSQSATSFLTLSFWVKSSVTQTFYGNIQSVDGTQRSFPFSFALTAGAWKKVTVKIPGNTSPTVDIDNNNGAGLYIDIWPFAGTNYTASGVTLESWATYSSSSRFADNTTTWYTTNDATFDVTGVQLELGSVATDFEHRSLAVEKSLCSRYCQVMTSNATSERMNFANVVVHGAGNGVYIMVGLLPMRSAPSVSTTGSFEASVLTGSWTATAVSSITSEFTTANGNDRGTWGYDGMLAATLASSYTTGLSGQIFSNSGFGQFVFSAEL
jgi:hypothetical protein